MSRPGAALGVVPVLLDEPGTVRTAVRGLLDSGVVQEVVVVAARPPDDAGGGRLLTCSAGARLLSCPAGTPLLGLLREAAARAADRHVLVHDPLLGLEATEVAELAGLVLLALRGRPDFAGAVPVRPVTDTLKWVLDGEIVGTPARELFEVALTPQAYTARAWLAATGSPLPAAEPEHWPAALCRRVAELAGPVLRLSKLH